MTALIEKLPNRVYETPLEEIPKELLEKSDTVIPVSFKDMVASGLKAWKDFSKSNEELLLQITRISYNVLSSDAIKVPSFAKKAEPLIPYSIITSPQPKEVYFELNEYTEEKTGNSKMGSSAIRIALKKASIVWESKSRKLYPFTEPLEIPREFELSTREKPRICPKPYGHFISIETEKTVTGYRQITFSQQFKYDLCELNLEDKKTGPYSLSYAQLFSITKQLLQSLEKIHIAEKSHGDIKPENIVVSENKEVAVLIDFDNLGPKTCTDQESYHTDTFSAYEYLHPGTKIIDLQKADLFALGCAIKMTMIGQDLEWFSSLDIYFSDSDTAVEEKKSGSKKCYLAVTEIKR